jgi:hypothetical protein
MQQLFTNFDTNLDIDSIKKDIITKIDRIIEGKEAHETIAISKKAIVNILDNIKQKYIPKRFLISNFKNSKSMRIKITNLISDREYSIYTIKSLITFFDSQKDNKNIPIFYIQNLYALRFFFTSQLEFTNYIIDLLTMQVNKNEESLIEISIKNQKNETEMVFRDLELYYLE